VQRHTLSLHLLRATLSWSFDIDRRAQAQLLHNSVSFRAEAAALAAHHVPAFDLVRNHLVKKSSHLVDAATTRGAVESRGRGSGFHVCWVAREWRVVASTGGKESDGGEGFAALAAGGGVVGGG